MDSFQKKYEEILAEIPTSSIGRVFDELKDGLGGRPLVLYGAGRSAGPIWDYCRQYGLPVACICDGAKTGVFGGEGGLPIIAPQAKVVICSFAYNDEIHSSLLQNGFLPEQIVRYPAKYPYLETPRTFGQYLDGYRWAYDFFEDGISRQLVLDRMRLYVMDTPMRPNTACTLYYEEGFISLSENEVFVDGGVYDGDTIEAFIGKMREAGKPYSHIYAFEPSPANCAKAVQRLSGLKNVDVVQKGLWSAEKELLFFETGAAMGGSSFVAGSGNGRAVPVTSLDVFFRGRPDGELPTFIKMDVEGAEKEALLGASGIIRRKKPKLSICAYHKPEDVFELPRTIMGIRDDYRFCLRQHCAGPCDTVLYAV